MLAAVGTWPPPAAGAPGLAPALRRASATPVMDVRGFFGPTRPHISYALASSNMHLIVYAESALHPRQPLKVARNSAFADLDYALYLGTLRPARQVVGGHGHLELPLTGRTAVVTTTFGDNSLYLVATPSGELGALC